MKILTEFWKYLKCSGLVLCCLFITVKTANAQADSLRTVEIETQDSVKIKRLDPRKALFYSAVFPGLGQMYNNKYWKLPIVYGGFVGGVMIIQFYQKNYVKFRDELYIYLATGKAPSGKSETSLRYIVGKSRRERDYYVILTGIWYLLQIVDAHVDAHLQEFQLNKDMKISLRPSVERNTLIGKTTGLTFTLKF